MRTPIRRLFCFLGAHAWYYQAETLTAQSGEEVFIATWHCSACGFTSLRHMFRVIKRPTNPPKKK